MARSGQPSSPTWASWQWSALTVNCLAASALTCSSRRCSFCPGFLGSASQPRLVVLAGTSLAVSDVAGRGQTSRFTFASWQCSFAASALQAVVKVAAAPLRTGTDQPCSFSFCLQSSAWRLLLFVPAVISFTASALVCSGQLCIGSGISVLRAGSDLDCGFSFDVQLSAVQLRSRLPVVGFTVSPFVLAVTSLAVSD